MEIWLELLEGTNAKEVACAAFNPALACEMQGHFELAENGLSCRKLIICLKQVITWSFLRIGINKNAVLKKDSSSYPQNGVKL